MTFKYFASSKMRLAPLIVVVLLILRQCGHSFAGNAASKGSLVKTTQVNGASFNAVKDTSSLSRSQNKQYNNGSESDSPVQRLKRALLDGYDATMPPVYDYKENILIKVGFTYRQVLDLDEKNQVLKSLVWYRVVWKDYQFVWNPEEFGGIKEIEIPHQLIWFPDIVVYEEVGSRSYPPRLVHVQVVYDGTVKYQEPSAFETSCSIDTAFFPFDVQVCHMTFVSWSQPISRIDLSSDRSSLKLEEDTDRFFINTGEWRLAGISVKKNVRDYGSLILSTKASSNASLHNASSHNDTDEGSGTGDDEVHFEHHGPLVVTATQQLDTKANNNFTITDSMFAEVAFTVVLRRNSSLYMQSMLFPSVILTTVALLGFYLPPDSGERIGLQITILLTFMVFLLAVGEMFPASTGPYLGVYFVICMGLLGVNLMMTVMVLHVHFKPIVNDFQVAGKRRREGGKKKQGRCRVRCLEGEISSDEDKHGTQRSRKSSRNDSSIPTKYRRILQFFDKYWTLGERDSRWMAPIVNDAHYDDVKPDDGDISEADDVTYSDNESNWSDSRVEGLVQKEVPKTVNYGIQPKVVDVEYITEAPKKHGKQLSSPMELTLNQSPSNNKEGGKSRKSSAEDLRADKTPTAGNLLQNKWSVPKSKMFSALADVKGFLAKSETERKEKRKLRKRRKRELERIAKEEEQERQDLEQEEWKSVARAVDVMFFRLYVIFIVASHLGLLVAILVNLS